MACQDEQLIKDVVVKVLSVPLLVYSQHCPIRALKRTSPPSQIYPHTYTTTTTTQDRTPTTTSLVRAPTARSLSTPSNAQIHREFPPFCDRHG